MATVRKLFITNFLICLVVTSIVFGYIFFRQSPNFLQRPLSAARFFQAERDPAGRDSPAVKVSEQPKMPVDLVFKSNGSYDKFCTFLKVPEYGNKAVLCTLDPTKDGNAPILQRDHAWETHLINPTMAALKRFREQPGKPRLSLFDAGCNHGVFTITAAVLGFEVLAIDTIKNHLEVVAASLKKNHLTSMVTLVNRALSNEHRKVLIPVHHTEMADWYDPKTHGSQPPDRLVDAVTMDDLIPLVRTKRVFLKMDIERSEGRALRGASKFFAEIEVVCVLMEWEWVKQIDEDRRFILEFLTDRGYQAYRQPTDTSHLPADNSMSWPHDVYWLKTA